MHQQNDSIPALATARKGGHGSNVKAGGGLHGSSGRERQTDESPAALAAALRAEHVLAYSCSRDSPPGLQL